jgi:hypothetical protein
MDIVTNQFVDTTRYPVDTHVVATVFVTDQMYVYAREVTMVPIVRNIFVSVGEVITLMFVTEEEHVLDTTNARVMLVTLVSLVKIQSALDTLLLKRQYVVETVNVVNRMYVRAKQDIMVQHARNLFVME